MVYNITKGNNMIDMQGNKVKGYKNIVCPDCSNKDESKFQIIFDFGEDFEEIKFGCTICFETILLTYDELKELGNEIHYDE